MPDENKEANTEVIEPDLDKILDDFEAPSASEEDGSKNTEEQDTGVDQSKKANLDNEVDKESGIEAKLAKVAEILGDDAEAIDAYVKSKGYHKDPAWQKLLAKSKTPAIDEETQKSLDEFKKVTSSREYIEHAMKANGFTQEAIDKELVKRGFEVSQKAGDDVQLVISKLGIDPKTVDEGMRATISDISKIADILIQDRLGKTLPSTLKPIEENLNKIQSREKSSKIVNDMKAIVTKDGVLDFEKDIRPAIAKWLDENPEAKQEDVFDYFKELNHSLTIERLKTGKKQVERTKEKGNLRGNLKPGAIKGEIPKKTGDFDKDADDFLDSLGFHE